MSRHSVFEKFVDTKLREIVGISVKLCAPGQLGAVPPDTYPGITHALDESPLMESPRAHGRRYWRRRKVTGYVLIHGTSDAAQTGDARYDAWEWIDAVEGALDGKHPLSSAMPAATATASATTVGHIETGTAEPFVSDAGLFGVAVPWSAWYGYETNRESEP